MTDRFPVLRTFLKSKIHRATVTDANLNYMGSITIDRNLMNWADLEEYERVDVYNIDNGERFSTYVIEGEAGSGCICLNGAAAHLVRPGHKVIIASYVMVEERHMKGWTPKNILVGEGNRVEDRKIK